MEGNEKLEHWYELLGEAEKLSSQFSRGYSDNFFSAEEFNAALCESVKKLEHGENQEIQRLYSWFAPSYDWDDFTHSYGEELGNKIFNLLSDIRSEL